LIEARAGVTRGSCDLLVSSIASGTTGHATRKHDEEALRDDEERQ